MVADGAMGSELYERGVLYTTCYEELCLSRPALIKKIHADYIKAGAQVIETNTFGANKIRLQRHGFDPLVYKINRAGAELARGSADESGSKIWVSGALVSIVKLKGGVVAELSAASVARTSKV